jgi:D-3-phosphoglycerate dehydrogenase / 2-oxoglutarate reductase
VNGTVLVLGGALAVEGRAVLEQAGLRVIETRPYPSQAATMEAMRTHRPAGVIIRGIAGVLDGAAMQAGGRLGVVAKHGVGTDDIDVRAANELGIPVAVTTGANSQSVAEHAFAMILALAKNLLRQDALVRAGPWDKERYQGRELRGQVLGLVGFGATGQALARMAAPLGMEIFVFDPYVPDSAVNNVARRATDLDALLAGADLVSLHCPLTAETRGLIDARRLGLLKPTAYLVNTARGEVVDEAALAEALAGGRLAGAGLDSFAAEPPDPDNPLFRLANTIVTPHVAGVTVETKRAMSVRAAENVVAILGGAELPPRFLVHA